MEDTRKKIKGLAPMTPTPELKSAQDLTSADFLAERVKEAYQSLAKDNLSDIETLFAPDI